MYHLLTGNTPASAQERFLVPESLPSPRKINPAIPASMAEAVIAAMAPHPKDRPSSVDQWRQMLRSSVSTAPMGMRQPMGSEWPASLRENWWLVGVAAVLLAASFWMTFN